MITIVLPAYNEERSLPFLLDRIPAAREEWGEPYRVIVVNDGSQDATPAIAAEYGRRMPLQLINHDGNKGLGAAIRTGLIAAIAATGPNDCIVTLDADNTHDPALIAAMRRELAKGYDIVIASRYQEGGREIGLSLIRSVFSKGASWLLRLFFPIPGARDYTCGFRLYRGSLMKQALAHYGDGLVEEQGFTCMAEILIKLGHLGARVSEIPLVLRYDLKEGASKMKVGRTIRRYFVLIARLRRSVRTSS